MTQRRIDLYPLLLAAYPVLFVLSQNVGLMPMNQVIVPLALTLSLTGMLWLVLTLVLQDRLKAGLLTGVFWVLFFSYGALAALAEGTAVGSFEIRKYRYVLPGLWCLCLFVCSYLVARTRKHLRPVADFLNVFAAILFAFVVVRTVYGLAGHRKPASVPSSAYATLAESGTQPDIYYIILDECARADVLKDLYGLEIDGFVQRMEQKGFFVAQQARSNYSQTYLSLASSLNFVYLDELIAEVGSDSKGRLPLREMILKNRVMALLKEKGYRTVSFASGMEYTGIKSADRYMTNRWSLSEYQNVLLNMTPIVPLLNRALLSLSGFQYESHRQRILYPLEHLVDMAEDGAPTLTLAHILACHPPFVLGENGEPVNPDQPYALLGGNFFTDQYGRDEYVQGYRSQLAYLLKRVEQTSDELIAASSQPPIIIVQADHGGGSRLDFEDLDKTDIRERMAILSMYYLPMGGSQALYDEITPVNTFRIVLNHYFDAGLPLLDDESYYSPASYPYRLTNVTHMVK